ncbi:hypothetical protein D3C78_1200690 [compost metagenome]
MLLPKFLIQAIYLQELMKSGHLLVDRALLHTEIMIRLALLVQNLLLILCGIKRIHALLCSSARMVIAKRILIWQKHKVNFQPQQYGALANMLEPLPVLMLFRKIQDYLQALKLRMLVVQKSPLILYHVFNSVYGNQNLIVTITEKQPLML